MTDPVDEAVARFDQGFNCAQSIFCAFASQHGLDLETALRLASPLGGGVARRGHICGAVSGGLLALGLGRGAASVEGKEAAYQLGQEFFNRFEARHQTVMCRDLVGYDVSRPEERQKMRAAGVIQTKCRVFVREAAEIVRDMLAAAGERSG